MTRSGKAHFSLASDVFLKNVPAENFRAWNRAAAERKNAKPFPAPRRLKALRAAPPPMQKAVHSGSKEIFLRMRGFRPGRNHARTGKHTPRNRESSACTRGKFARKGLSHLPDPAVRRACSCRHVGTARNFWGDVLDLSPEVQSHAGRSQKMPELKHIGPCPDTRDQNSHGDSKSRRGGQRWCSGKKRATFRQSRGADAPPRGKTSEKMTKLFINGQKTIP